MLGLGAAASARYAPPLSRAANTKWDDAADLLLSQLVAAQAGRDKYDWEAIASEVRLAGARRRAPGAARAAPAPVAPHPHRAAYSRPRRPPPNDAHLTPARTAPTRPDRAAPWCADAGAGFYLHGNAVLQPQTR